MRPSGLPHLCADQAGPTLGKAQPVGRAHARSFLSPTPPSRSLLLPHPVRPTAGRAAPSLAGRPRECWGRCQRCWRKGREVRGLGSGYTGTALSAGGETRQTHLRPQDLCTPGTGDRGSGWHQTPKTIPRQQPSFRPEFSQSQTTPCLVCLLPLTCPRPLPLSLSSSPGSPFCPPPPALLRAQLSAAGDRPAWPRPCALLLPLAPRLSGSHVPWLI